MKIRNILTILLVSVLLLALAACGNSQLSSQLSGKYVIVNIEDDPDGLTLTGLEDILKEEDLNVRDNFYFEFSDNNRFTLILFGKTEMAGRYEKNGDTLTLAADGETEAGTATLLGKKITWTYETGAKLVFEKDGLSTGAIIGIIAGSVALILTIGIAIFVVKKKKKA